MSPVDVGVVGLGFMGGRWAQCLAEHPGARLRVVSDVREDLGRQLADRWEATYVADPLEAAADPALLGVAVCTPEHLHVDIALAAIEAGKVLMVEKPLAHTISDAERIRDRAAELDTPVLAGHILRFEPRYAAVARAVHEGEIGEVQAVRNERIGLVTDQVVLQGRTTVPLYYGVHEFDLARWYGGEIASIHAYHSAGVLHARGFGVEDLYSAAFQYVSGAHGTAMLGWILPDRMPGMGLAGVTVIGEHGILRVDQGELGILKVGEDGVDPIDILYSPEVHGRTWGALAIEVDHFVQCVQGSVEPLCTAADSTEAVRISLAMEEAAETSTSVAVRTARVSDDV
jgi:myo-inositol 2-dehydrogenase/D-chiro-inositol 1-dehydrogenase